MEDTAPQQAAQPAPASSPVTTPEIDSTKLAALVAELRAKQNLGLGLIAGVAAALAGAAIWAVVTVVTHYQIGWMAVGVGFLVGLAIRVAGKGIEPRFGYMGGALALVGCLAGNLFSAVGFAANEFEVSFFQLLGNLGPSTMLELLKATFSPMDLLFYGIAVYEGYKFSFAQISEADLAKVTT